MVYLCSGGRFCVLLVGLGVLGMMFRMVFCSDVFWSRWFCISCRLWVEFMLVCMVELGSSMFL